MRTPTIVAASALVATSALHAGGPVLGWGTTLDGQLPVPSGLGSCNTLSAGSGHSVAIRAAGTVACWGLNDNGQSTVPGGLGSCVVVSAGGRHTAAVRSTGAIACWGDNSNGQCAVPAGLGTCTQVSCGDSHTVALRTNGLVACWGDNSLLQSTVPAPLGICTAVEAGTFHTLVIQANGSVGAWGDRSQNQGLVPNGLGACISIGAGDLHSAAVKVTGAVVCWGSNGQGQCTVPAALKPCVAVACGDFHTVALQQDGVVAAWGYSASGQAQVPTNLPKCTQIAGGGSHSLALSSDVAVPTGVAATDGESSASVTISWTAAAGASGYRVFRAVGAGLGAQIGTTTTPTTFVDTTATAGISYTYWVKATTAAGDSVPSATDTGWRNIATPTGVTASDGTLTTGVAISWSAVAGATGYRVYRAVGAGAATQIGLPTGTTFSDTTATAGTVYTYTVRARSAAGNTLFSAPDTGWRNLPAPTAVSATDGTFTTKVRISWAAVAGATGYVVYRQLPGAANASIATIASGSTLLFNDTTIAPGVVAQYRVRTKSAAGVSGYSTANSGYRRAAFVGDPSEGRDEGTDGSEDEGEQATALDAADEWASGRRPATTGKPATTVGSANDSPIGDWGSEDGNAVSPPPVPSCDDLVMRILSRIAWLRNAGKDNLAGQAEADALAALLPDPVANGPVDGCHACAMARGDVNLDGQRDTSDLVALLGAIANGDMVVADLNRDGWLDAADLALLASGHSGPG